MKEDHGYTYQKIIIGRIKFNDYRKSTSFEKYNDNVVSRVDLQANGRVEEIPLRNEKDAVIG